MTGCERILALLSDGRQHSHHELYALNVIVHSRVAELRKRGHDIECSRDGDIYSYRLLTSLEEPPRLAGPGGSSSEGPSTSPGGALSLDSSGEPLSERSGPGSPDPPSEQLVLDVAA